MLSNGETIGPYQIVALLGEGGMGVVYRARDSRLGRDIALKVLPASFAQDADRLRRFEQEARTLAALNHPNLLAIYDLGAHGGAPYLVTELLEGETLRARLGSGAMSSAKAVEICRQLCDGLAAAHDKGMVHRDLKPENVFLSRDGRAKVLDFGLAKLAQPDSSAEAATMVASLPGMIVGTVGYMSPEQVRGQAVDARSDLFALGTMFYEMVSGRRAFQRETGVETMTAILNAEPADLPASGIRLSPLLEAVVRRALEKEPAQRFQSARDFSFALTQASGSSGTVLSSAAPGRRFTPAMRTWGFRAGIALLLVGVSVGATYFALRGSTATDLSAYRFRPISFEPGGSNHAQWSPDGKRIAYSAAASSSDPDQVFVRDLDAPAPVQLTHNGFNLDGSGDDAQVEGWMPDNRRIVYSRPAHADLWTVSTAGGAPAPLPLPAIASDRLWTMAVAPNANALAIFYRDQPGAEASIWYSDPLGSPLRRYRPDPFAGVLVNNVPVLHFSPDGRHLLLYFNPGTGEQAWLMDYPPRPGKVPRRVLQSVSTFSSTPAFSFFPDGRHIALGLLTDPNGSGQIFAADPDGRQARALTAGTSFLRYPVVSPDGAQMLVTQWTSDFDIVSVDLATAGLNRMIATPRNEAMPAWAAKSPSLVYVTDRDGPPEIWLRESGRPDRPLVTPADFPPGTSHWFMSPALSADGGRVIFTRVAHQAGGIGAVRLWMAAVAGGAPVELTDGTGGLEETPGSWSPDGNAYVFMGLAGVKGGVYVVDTSGAAHPRKIADNPSGIVPAWSPAGDWIAYCDSDNIQLISPDGQRHRALGKCDGTAYGFSADGKWLYGIRTPRNQVQLFARDVAAGTERVIGDVGEGNGPSSYVNPSIRLSLAPDGKSFVYSINHATNNLWLLRGFPKP